MELSSIEKCLQLILRPVVGFALKHGIKLSEIVEKIKRIMVEIAISEFVSEKEIPSSSAISAMTGVHRKDVRRIVNSKDSSRPVKNLVQRILGQWQNDLRFSNGRGRPRQINIIGEHSEFVALVKSVSTDLNPYTVLAELERLGFVVRKKNKLKLNARVFIAKGDYLQGFNILAKDYQDLIHAVEENVKSSEPRNLHLRTEYDNVDIEALPVIQAWLIEEGSAFHTRVRNYLAQYDRDLNPKLSNGKLGARVVFGAFSHTEKNEQEIQSS